MNTKQLSLRSSIRINLAAGRALRLKRRWTRAATINNQLAMRLK